MNTKTYAQVIRKRREIKAWSQQHLAEAADLNVRTVQRIEAGQPCSKETLRAFAIAFDCDVKDLPCDEMAAGAGETNLPDDFQYMCRITAGSDLICLGAGAGHLSYQLDESLAAEQRTASAAFLDNSWEYLEVWDELSSSQRLAAEDYLSAQIQELDERGLILLGRVSCNAIPGGSNSLRGLLLAVFRLDSPEIVQVNTGISDGRLGERGAKEYDA